jgi:hypothetical protein
MKNEMKNAINIGNDKHYISFENIYFGLSN